MTDVVDLGHRKRAKQATEARDCRAWTARDALLDAIKRIDDGDIPEDAAVFIAFQVTSENPTRFPYNAAGAGRTELVGILTAHIHDLLDGL